MSAMQAPRHVQGLIQRAEDHCEDDIEGPMKPSDWISKRRRVIGNRGGHPGMRELEKQRPSRSEEHRCFAIYFPDCGLAAEYTFGSPGCALLNESQEQLRVIACR